MTRSLTALAIIFAVSPAFAFSGVDFRKAVWELNEPQFKIQEALPSLSDSALFHLAAISPEFVDNGWQAQFKTGISWTRYGVIDGDDSVNNDAALATLPPYTPIIADCPHGKKVQFSANFLLISGLRIKFDDNCYLETTNTTLGVFAIISPATITATLPSYDIQLYNMNLNCKTPTTGVRAMQLWVDDLTIRGGNVIGCGMLFLRGYNQEITGVNNDSIIYGAGNPFIRDFGNMPSFPGEKLTRGRQHATWIHGNHAKIGDAGMQVCQPGTNPLTWLFNTSSYDIQYDHNWVESVTDAMLLVNIPNTTGGTTYTCDKITFSDNWGKGKFCGIVSDSPLPSTNIVIRNFYCDATNATGFLPAFGIGAFNYAGLKGQSNPNTTVTLDNVNIFTPLITGLGIAGGQVSVNRLTITTPRAGVSSTGATVSIDNNSVVTITNSNIDAGKNVAAISDGVTSKSSGLIVTNTNITGVSNGDTGYLLGHSSRATITGGSVTSNVGATSATGITMTRDASGRTHTFAGVFSNQDTIGTHDANISGVDLSGVQTPVICAPGQGNSVPGC